MKRSYKVKIRETWDVPVFIKLKIKLNVLMQCRKGQFLKVRKDLFIFKCYE